jgi:hypothetical protein
MDDLKPRDWCLQHLRDRTRGDLWLASYALFAATQEMDLGSLNRLVDVLALVDDQRNDQAVALSKLLAERFDLH